LSERQSGIGELIDIFRVREYFGGITQLRDLARRVRDDAAFVGEVRRALAKLPTDQPPPRLSQPLWPKATRRARVRRGRLGIAATGGSGALACLVGVFKACEELGVHPSALSFASGAALFAFPIAAGMAPDDVAKVLLAQDPSEWLDPDWTALATILPKRGRGFSGIIKGERLESSFTRLLGPMKLKDLRIPAYAPVWNIERNRLEYIGPRTHPELKVARAIRMAVSLPLFFDPVRWRGGSWNDGAVVDIFPVHPLLDIEPHCDAVLAVNCFYPPGFAGENAEGWNKRSWSVVDIADQVVTAQHLQLARENLRRLRAEVKTVTMIEPVPYRLVRRTGFYSQFLDRSQWPDFMRWGRRATLKALSGRAKVAGRPS